MKLGFFLLSLLAAIAIACDSDETPEPTATTQDSSPSASATVSATEAVTPTSSLQPSEDGGWDEGALWQDYYESEVFSCLPSGDVKTCVLEVAEGASVAPEVSDFITQNEAVLVTFQELGTVDYGEVSWVAFNMGRPEPVFLNGDFGLRYYGTVVPEDWREGDPSYEAIEVDGSGFGPYPWAEYSQLVSSESDASGQRMVIETVIQGCRACAPVAFLALEIAFDAKGALSGVTVLPMRCEPEAEYFQGINIAEGPCSPP
jgi:hypothetical protein